MLKTFIFVPSNKDRFIKKSRDLTVDEIILDLEDAVNVEELDMSLKNLENLKNKSQYWVRPRLFDGKNLDFSILEKLLSLGFKKFFLPKVSNFGELLKIKKQIAAKFGTQSENLDFVLLVENPQCLIGIQQILESKILNIVGIILGSHDYCKEMNMEHSSQNLRYAKHHLLNIAKSFNIMYLDTASMNINDQKSFNEEVREAFSMGSDGKAVIHPRQLRWMNNYPYFSSEEVEKAKSILSKLDKIGKDKFNVLKYNGEVFERPHLERLERMVNWKNNESK